MKVAKCCALLVLLVPVFLSGCGSGGSGEDDDIDNNLAPPLLILRSVTNDSITTNQVNLPVIGSTSSTASITVNGVSTAVDGDGNFTTTVTLMPGANVVTVIATQNSIQTTALFTATLMQTPPLLTINSPASMLSTNNTNLTVTGTTAPSGVEVRVNGLLQTLLAGAFSQILNLTDGANLVRIVATDAAGNETVVERNVVLDQSSPILAVHSPADASTIYVEPLVVDGETEANVTLTINGNPVALGAGPGLVAFSEALSAYEAVSNLEVIATDIAGNSTTINLLVNRFAKPGTLYVSSGNPNSTNSASCGSLIEPCLTINQGLVRASATFATQVLVSTGAYLEQVVLIPGVDLLGGFNDDFSLRNLAALKAEIWGDGSDRSVIASSISGPTLLEGFVIRGPNMASASSNSIALYVSDSQSNLLVRNNRIVGGRGADGAEGTSGTDGPDGPDGVDGATGRLLPGSCTSTDLVVGSQGGSQTVGGQNISGGAGGGNGTCPDGNLVQVSADDGSAGFGTGGSGGAAGHDAEIMGGLCTLPMAPRIGQPGNNGQAGSSGSAAAGGSGSSIISGNWLGDDGNSGGIGTSGGGGGGGGAAGSVRCVDASCGDRMGGTGGGGAAGGGRGVGGNGGGFGGASFTVFMTFNSTPASLPEFSNNDIELGIGGHGGRGGNGGTGGNGGEGGLGGGIPLGTFCLQAAGAGGEGGQGGHGGGGGGGTGGPVAGMFLNLSGFAGTFDYDLNNNISITSGIAGIGGSGGASLGAGGGAGTNASLSAIMTN